MKNISVKYLSVKYISLLLFLSLFLLSCSEVASPPGYDYDHPTFTPVHEAKLSKPRSFPWEIWPVDVDLVGNRLTNFLILSGDKSFKEGDRARAYEFYQRARSTSIDLPSREALTLRISSCELAFDQPEKALNTAAEFLKGQHRGSDDTDLRFSLLLAFAYGRKSDVEQSLAWFSRVYRTSSGRGSLAIAAQSGAAQLLRSVNTNDFDSMVVAWESDSFVRSLIGEEKRRRSLLGTQFTVARGKPFWDLGFESGRSTTVVDAGHSVTAPAGQVPVIGLLLPLTGQYGPLGVSTKNGIELALQSEIVQGGLKLAARDSGMGSEQSVREFSNLVDQDKASIVLGPILADSANAILPLLRERSFPLITFSKRADINLEPNSFRLGATTQSQVRSLVRSTNQALGFTKYGVAYPSDASGIEFAKAFKAELNALGLAAEFDASYAAGDLNSVGAVAEQLEATQLQALFIPDVVDRAAILVSDLTPKTRAKLRVLGPATWDNQTTLANSRTVLEGAIFVSAFYDRSSRELITKFIEAYTKKYGYKPDFLAAQGFDSATMVLAALRRQWEEGLPFVSSFRQISRYDGLTGAMTVLQNGEIDRQYAVLELKAGQVRELSSELIQSGSSLPVVAGQVR